MSHFLQRLPREEKQQVQARTSQLIDALVAWAPQYPDVRPARIPPLALFLASVAPRLTHAGLLLVAKLTLLIFVIDDLADEGQLTLEELDAKALQWQGFAHFGVNEERVLPGSPEALLLEVRAGLQDHPLFSALCGVWASRLGQLVTYMAQEKRYAQAYHLHGTASLPSLEEYLCSGAHTIGLPAWGTAVLILEEGPDVLNSLDFIEEAILLTGRSIRLYNDFRTLSKEVQEGNINSIIILQQELLHHNPRWTPERCLEQAKDQVSQLAENYSKQLEERLLVKRFGCGNFVETLVRSVAFHAFFYGSQSHQLDYHTTSVDDVHSLLESN